MLKASKNSSGVELYKNPSPVDSNQELFGQGLAISALVFHKVIQSQAHFLDQQ